ncbi:MAG TPA: hypothetical protein VK176_02885 [Phycisphaerales bacterium]|nr:hypothetical protein [Phycisphaerales bacterium]
MAAAHETPVEHEHVDAWHQHDLSVEGAPQSAHTAVANPFVLFASFIALSVVTAGLVGIVMMYYYRTVSNVGGIAQTQEHEATVRLSADAQAASQEAQRSLTNYEWVSPEQSKVSMPIDAAFERVIQNYGAAPASK